MLFFHRSHHSRNSVLVLKGYVSFVDRVVLIPYVIRRTNGNTNKDVNASGPIVGGLSIPEVIMMNNEGTPAPQIVAKS